MRGRRKGGPNKTTAKILGILLYSLYKRSTVEQSFSYSFYTSGFFLVLVGNWFMLNTE
jgi:hypothetical protein